MPFRTPASIILRLPFAFAPHGEPLGEMTLKTLARGRMCVSKIIAEPERRGPRNNRQGGLRGNSIAFPQQRLELLESTELPAAPEQAADFMSRTVVIALAGVETDDFRKQLHTAKWAEIPRQHYLDAARFCAAHGMAYEGVSVNEERACEMFAVQGRTSDAVLQQAVPILSASELAHRLEGPADTGTAAAVQENPDGEMPCEHRADEDHMDETGTDLNAALPDEEFASEALPTMHFCADDVHSGGVNELAAVRKVYKEIHEVRDALAKEIKADTGALQSAVKTLMSRSVTDSILQAGAQADSSGQEGPARSPCEQYRIHTGSQPLSMYGAPIWAMCFPDCFPYGDGVFGLPRATPLTFQQCAGMHLLREELDYHVTAKTIAEAKAWCTPTCSEDSEAHQAASPACTCVQCMAACQAFQPPQQPRWGRNRELLCCYYDTWRRMEQVRRARAHVRRSGYRSKLEKICSASADKIEAAIKCVGENGTIRDVLRSGDCDSDLKEALAELMVFTTDVVGSDGARAKLRHEQSGFCLMFGPSGGFLTPNVSDVRNPLVVVLHGGGIEERFEINLFEESPDMPSAREMLQIVADDPVAQARFFIFSMRLFCEHVLGSGPVDDCLRHNGWRDGPAFPDGFAASTLGGAFGIVAAYHGPIEEQARLSLHPHINLWFVNTTSQAWLRHILRGDTADAQARLRRWQERVLRMVQSTQLDSAAVLPLLLVDDPSSVSPPMSTPFSRKQQADCRFDGKLEMDERDSEKRRPLVATSEFFVDHHIRQHRDGLQPGDTPKTDYLLPLKGAHLSRMPAYRLLKPVTEDVPLTEEDMRAEAKIWSQAFAEDYRGCISLGMMHEHKDTCFKYVIQQGVQKAKHCRFHFNHFVKVAVRRVENGVSRVLDKVFARTGKDLVLPRQPGQQTPNLIEIDEETGEPKELKPTCCLGPTVITDVSRGMHGRILPIRWNPLEGSSNGIAQVSVRGNLDYQSMLRTFDNGFHTASLRDELRDPPVSDLDLERERCLADAVFESELGAAVQAVQQEHRKKNLPEKTVEVISAELRKQREACQVAANRGERLGDRLLPLAVRRFMKWVRNMVIEAMSSSIAASFYACDYSTKPNMTCAPLLVALQDGVERLERRLQEEREEERLEELQRADMQVRKQKEANVDNNAATHKSLAGIGPNNRRPFTKLEREASRRLIRQATAANSAIVKGNCLMVMQILTRREALKSHTPWQLMTKHAMWMALEHRRQLGGMAGREEVTRYHLASKFNRVQASILCHLVYLFYPIHCSCIIYAIEGLGNVNIGFGV